MKLKLSDIDIQNENESDKAIEDRKNLIDFLSTQIEAVLNHNPKTIIKETIPASVNEPITITYSRMTEKDMEVEAMR